MSVRLFVPTIWAKEFLSNLDEKHLAKKAFNHDYAGLIKNAGDTVKIHSLGEVLEFEYIPNQDMAAPQILEGAEQILSITEARSFNFYIDDVDEAQANYNIMSEAMDRSAYAVSRRADIWLFGVLKANVGNTLAAVPTAGTGAGDADAYEILVDLMVRLDENNVPEAGRYVYVSPRFHGLLLKDPRFVSFGTDKNRQNLRGDPVGTAANFTVYRTNNLPDGDSASDDFLIAGHTIAATMADQINQIEPYKPEKRFGDAVKGLYLYGAKVTRPYAIAGVSVGYA